MNSESKKCRKSGHESVSLAEAAKQGLKVLGPAFLLRGIQASTHHAKLCSASGLVLVPKPAP